MAFHPKYKKNNRSNKEKGLPFRGTLQQKHFYLYSVGVCAIVNKLNQRVLSKPSETFAIKNV